MHKQSGRDFADGERSLLFLRKRWRAKHRQRRKNN
jgi:hypothetical protein